VTGVRLLPSKSLQAVADAMVHVGEWLAGHPEVPPGTVEVTPEGDVTYQLLRPVGGPDPSSSLRRLASTLPSAVLEVDPDLMQLSDRRWGHMLRLCVPVPGTSLLMWCLEAVSAVPFAPDAMRAHG